MDETILHLINETWTNGFFDYLMPIVSAAEIWKPFFLIAFALALVFGGFKGRACVICMVMILLAWWRDNAFPENCRESAAAEAGRFCSDG